MIEFLLWIVLGCAPTFHRVEQPSLMRDGGTVVVVEPPPGWQPRPPRLHIRRR